MSDWTPTPEFVEKLEIEIAGSIAKLNSKSERKLKLIDQQVDAILKVVWWFRKVSVDKQALMEKPYFLLCGYAGVGKTSVAKVIADVLGPKVNIKFVAPTGKAASVLTRKGTPATTIHRLIYNVEQNQETGKLVFRRRDSIDADMLVVDEASMVGTEAGEDLAYYGKPMLALGDSAQLLPINQAQYFDMEHPDAKLTKVQRQGENSNILAASMKVRRGKPIPVGDYGDLVVHGDQYPTRKSLIYFSGIDTDRQVICGYNKTRTRFNNLIRDELGFDTKLPMVGEKIICLMNNYDESVVNGEQFIVTTAPYYPDVVTDPNEKGWLRYSGYRAKSATDLPDGVRMMKVRVRPAWDATAAPREVSFNPHCFDADPNLRALASTYKGAFDFGYVITAHKSQGSEWEEVLVLQEPVPDTEPNWSYTAITRASKLLHLHIR